MWILAEFDNVLRVIKHSWENIDIYSAAQAIKSFATGVFPSHWLEMSKSRLYDGNESASWTIHRIVKDLLTVFSPICPFFTHHLSVTLFDSSAVDVREFPDLGDIVNHTEATGLLDLTEAIIIFNSKIWKMKKDAGNSLNSPISGISIPTELSDFSDTLAVMHKIE